MKKEYEMTEAQLARLLDACTPVPYLIVGGHPPASPQDRANHAWAELGQELGQELGFDPWSVTPIPGKGQQFFMAEPC